MLGRYVSGGAQTPVNAYEDYAGAAEATVFLRRAVAGESEGCQNVNSRC